MLQCNPFCLLAYLFVDYHNSRKNAIQNIYKKISNETFPFWLDVINFMNLCYVEKYSPRKLMLIDNSVDKRFP